MPVLSPHTRSYDIHVAADDAIIFTSLFYWITEGRNRNQIIAGSNTLVSDERAGTHRITCIEKPV